MKNSSKLLIGLLVVALVGGAVYLGNTQSQKGAFRFLTPKVSNIVTAIKPDLSVARVYKFGREIAADVTMTKSFEGCVQQGSGYPIMASFQKFIDEDGSYQAIYDVESTIPRGFWCSKKAIYTINFGVPPGDSDFVFVKIDPGLAIAEKDENNNLVRFDF